MFCFPYQHFILTVILILKSLVTGHGQLTKHVHVDQESNRYYKSFMQLDTIGVSQCIKMCKRYKLCKKIHHNREQLTCDLMMTFAEKGIVTSLLDIRFTQEDDAKCGNCSETDVCMDTKDGSHICLEQDVCPQGWVSFSHKCYFFSNVLKTADQGIEFCEMRNAKLVRIDNRAVLDFLHLEMTTREMVYLWVSANDRAVEKTWVWGPGDEKVDESLWDVDEPNNGSHEDCAALKGHTGKMIDIDCNNWNAVKVVCEDHYKLKP